MRSSVWVSLIRIFPPEIQEKLMAVMTSGNEINISGVLRFEQDFLVVRGRLAGTTDDAGVVFLPFDRIDYIGFRVPMKDSELEALFANSGFEAPPPEVEATAAPVYAPAPSLAPVTRVMPPAAPTSRPVPAPAAAVAPPRPAAPEPAPEPIAPPPVPSAPAAAPAVPGSAILPGKAALLERLRRSRLNQDGPKSSEGK